MNFRREMKLYINHCRKKFGGYRELSRACQNLYG